MKPYLENAALEEDAQACDLCYVSLEGESAPEWLIAEGRAVCFHCWERFETEELDLGTGARVNRTIGLVARGYYAGVKKDPGRNEQLWGR